MAVSCGGDPTGSLSPTAAQGREVASQLGCAACHGTDGDGGVGPKWAGMWGREVELSDDQYVTFDEQYVTRSVREPDAERQAGDWVRMPAFGPELLDDHDLTALIAYLRELGGDS
ncbi:MAG TPA: cytochrome c [Ilumatobacter sp.]|nr:cytochrome c [Ilumatobacter sp.]